MNNNYHIKLLEVNMAFSRILFLNGMFRATVDLTVFEEKRKL